MEGRGWGGGGRVGRGLGYCFQSEETKCHLENGKQTQGPGKRESC